MLNLPGYEFTERLHEGARTLVFRGLRTADQLPMVAKTPRNPQPTGAEIARLGAEYEMGRELDHPRIVRIVALEFDGHRPALVMEDFGGRSLSATIADGPFALDHFLDLAIQIAEGLSALHQRHIIHKDINPANIIHNRERGAVKLIDLSIATLLDRETQGIENPDRIEGTLRYISPEQTGRMNRAVDYRSDFYSLGVTFFEMLAGHVPFPSVDAMELVHAHIARTPASLLEARPELPPIIDQIVAKLLAKTAEERYQTAAGLARDLRRCAEQLRAGEEVGGFSPGEGDVSGRLQIPQKLYGRSRELDQLFAGFDAAVDGARQLMCIAGPSGIGKSALVHELHRPVVQRDGWFVSGKFDQFQRDRPHSAFIEVVSELVQQVLIKSDDQVERWRERLLEAVGDEGQVLVDVLREVELVIGPQPPIPAMSPAEAEARFAGVMGRFFAAVAGADHPLVIFLDDLQWADPASSRLMELLLDDDAIHHLLVIGNFRPDEVGDNHPLTLTLRSIAAGSAPVTNVELTPLSAGHVAQLIAEALHSDSKQVDALAELLHKKTAGNPFFVGQFLRSLHDEELLTFDAAELTWRWDVDAIEARGIADNVVALLLEKMERLPAATRTALELAAAVGNRFDLATVAIIAGQSVPEAAAALHPAIDEGIVRPTSSSFGRVVAAVEDHCCTLTEAKKVGCAFVHDRFQQAAYSRIEEERRPALHLRLARLLRDKLDEAERSDRVFEVVHHFHRGRAALTDDAERVAVASLNLEAGNKAAAATAFDAARGYFEAGIELLPDDAWAEHYELAFELHIMLGECAVLQRDLSELGLRVGKAALDNARAQTDRMRAMATYGVELARSGEPHTAIELALEMLENAGYNLEPPDIAAATKKAYASLLEQIGDRPIADIAKLPAMTDPTLLAVTDTIRGLMFPLYMRRRDLIPYASIVGAQLSVTHGIAPLSGMGFSGLGRVVAHKLGDFRRGVEFSRLGTVVAEQLGTMRAGTVILGAGMVHWLTTDLRACVEELRAGFRMGVEDGETFFAGICASTLPTLGVCAGLPLDEVFAESELLIDYIDSNLGDVGLREIHMTRWFIDVLEGRQPADEASYFEDAEQEREMLRVAAVKNAEGATWYLLARAQIAALVGDHARALRLCEEAYSYADRDAMGTYAAYDLEFHHALALAATHPNPTPAELELLEQKAALLQGWVDRGARLNFHHKQLLVEAEIARLRRDREAAGPAYERAIEAAAAANITQDLARANELAAAFYSEQGLDKVAAVYLGDARYCYDKWGATIKVKRLDAAHPELAPAPVDAGPGTGDLTVGGTVSTTTAAGAHFLDFTTVIKATHAISSERKLSSVLQKLLEIISENAGAQRALLVLRQDDVMVLVAAFEPDSDEFELVDHEPVVGSGRLSPGIVNYVARTREPVVLADAARTGSFRSDPYVGRQRPRSVLCAPLVNQGRLAGVVYLENNLASGAFTPNRLEVVNLLCVQAAISIEAAQLYEGLETKVEARTRDLADKNEQLVKSMLAQKQMQNQLVMSEKMASLGNLVAGVAHEINTPIGAVVSSADVSRRAVEKLRAALQKATTLEDAQGGKRVTRLFGLLDDNIGVMSTAGERVGEIVRTLRNFARLDEAEQKEADIHEGIESTIGLVRHRLKRRVDVAKEYGELPPVFCFPNQLNQVFMNLLVNAVDAIEQNAVNNGVDLLQNLGTKLGHIAIKTWHVAADDTVHVRFTDDGNGIPAAKLESIFDPGFTTKGVGVGTGLGLSICFNIVDKHGGTIAVDSTIGEGSSFTVTLPVGKA